MVYQFIRESLRLEEADKLCHACQETSKKLIIWTLLDTGLRVSELCSLTPQNMLWQQKALRIAGKGGLYGAKSKKRIVPLSKRVQTLLEHYLPFMTNGLLAYAKCKKLLSKLLIERN